MENDENITYNKLYAPMIVFSDDFVSRINGTLFLGPRNMGRNPVLNYAFSMDSINSIYDFKRKEYLDQRKNGIHFDMNLVEFLENAYLRVAFNDNVYYQESEGGVYLYEEVNGNRISNHFSLREGGISMICDRYGNSIWPFTPLKLENRIEVEQSQEEANGIILNKGGSYYSLSQETRV